VLGSVFERAHPLAYGDPHERADIGPHRCSHRHADGRAHLRSIVFADRRADDALADHDRRALVLAVGDADGSAHGGTDGGAISGTDVRALAGADDEPKRRALAGAHHGSDHGAFASADLRADCRAIASAHLDHTHLRAHCHTDRRAHG